MTQINSKEKTTLTVESFNPKWTLENNGYVLRRFGDWIKMNGKKNRFHAHIRGTKIEIHYDKYHSDNTHSSIIKPILVEEIKKIIDSDNGKLKKVEELIDNCNKLSQIKIENAKGLIIKIEKNMIKKKPIYIPQFAWDLIKKMVINKII